MKNIITASFFLLCFDIFGQGNYVHYLHANFPEGHGVYIPDTTAGLSGPVDYRWDRDKEVIFKTDDYGNTWRQLAPIVHYHIPNFLSPYAKRLNGSILSEEYGKRFEPGLYKEKKFFGAQKSFSLRFANENTGYLVYHQDIYRTDDGGENWLYTANLYQMVSQKIYAEKGQFNLQAKDLPEMHQRILRDRIKHVSDGEEAYDPDRRVNVSFVDWVHDAYVLNEDFVVLVGEAPSVGYDLDKSYDGVNYVSSAWDSFSPTVLITKDGFKTLEPLVILPPATGLRRIDRAYFANEHWGELQYLDENKHWRTAYRTKDGGRSWEYVGGEDNTWNYGFIRE